MSHEIRTPLNALVGVNYLMRRDGATPEQAARLEKIDGASRHLLSLINDILDPSKIEAEHVKIETTNFHRSAVLDALGSTLGKAARAFVAARWPDASAPVTAELCGQCRPIHAQGPGIAARCAAGSSRQRPEGRLLGAAFSGECR